MKNPSSPPRAGHMLNQRLGEDLALEAHLTQAVPVSLELARDGAWLMVDLTGDVAFVYDGAADKSALPNGAAATAAAGAAAATGAAAAVTASSRSTSAAIKRPANTKRPVPSKQ